MTDTTEHTKEKFREAVETIKKAMQEREYSEIDPEDYTKYNE